ncbi:4Fe-4S dicluster domain-containing protein [Sabulicella glaciei]|uniref:4Fe-4S dicluster domain-containing protein n=1 Tax=Sabulicella glaciei TaxID=2984948 RepID=A0ABT3NRI8_9PROT|nr:4Fe-4S dicluster domain-containing protein [Roseococcus sp. MDT2-1-1]MCW8084780.1 4Fe-4S dicluster domain-containing protein [Roseococcus sp. MDT2-1-1]
MDGGLINPGRQEAERTAGARIEPGRSYGFFTDTTLCIGCKACEVACKEWNGLPADGDMRLSGHSYDNTGALGAETWRHVGFVERLDDRPGEMKPFQSNWIMFSDVCKHCDPAPCLEACPTGALFRTEFDTVVVQQDICNGCAYCVPACPFGVVEISKADGKAHKCTLCHDRMKGGMEPACAKACPTDSIQFGALEDLIPRAHERVEQLQEMGQDRAYLYGAPGTPGATHGIEKLNAFFLLTERPEVHGLPSEPVRPAPRAQPSLIAGLGTLAGLAAAALVFGLGGRR